MYLPSKIYIQMKFTLDFLPRHDYHFTMTNSWKSKNFVSHSIALVLLVSVFLAPFSSHAQRARTVTTTNSVKTTTNSTVATISKK